MEKQKENQVKQNGVRTVFAKAILLDDEIGDEQWGKNNPQKSKFQTQPQPRIVGSDVFDLVGEKEKNHRQDYHRVI